MEFFHCLGPVRKYLLQLLRATPLPGGGVHVIPVSRLAGVIHHYWTSRLRGGDALSFPFWGGEGAFGSKI